MYPKYKVQQLIEAWAPLIVTLLELDITIEWNVIHSKYVDDYLPEEDYNGEQAFMITSWENKVPIAEIWIFYDKQKGLKDAIGTIFHELFHVRMIGYKHGYDTEERLVRLMERVVLVCLCLEEK